MQGIIHVNVVHKKQADVLPLHSASEKGLTFFGREWLFEMKLDWREVLSINPKLYANRN